MLNLRRALIGLRLEICLFPLGQAGMCVGDNGIWLLAHEGALRLRYLYGEMLIRPANESNDDRREVLTSCREIIKLAPFAGRMGRACDESRTL